MKKKIVIFIYIIAFILSSSVYANDIKTELRLFEKFSEKKYLTNDQGYLIKTVTDINKDIGEAIVELKLSNTAKDEESKEQLDTEIVLVVDNSGSMDFKLSNGKKRKEVVVESAKNLTNKIYDNIDNVKMGIVRFWGKDNMGYAASIMSNVTSDKKVIISHLDSIAEMKTEPGTNIEAAILAANRMFTKKSKNKIIILLTDGIPNIDNEYNTDLETVFNNTKKTLQSIGDKAYIISIMTGVSDEDLDKEKNIKPTDIVKRIFGTDEKPTTGKFYNISDLDIDRVVSENVYKDLIKKVRNPINNVKMVDYFPKDIIENFEFSYVDKPNIGSISNEIRKNDNSIDWDIGTLKAGSVATVRYKLKIKDMKNKALLNKVLSTNEKVILTYSDNKNIGYNVVLDTSPKIQLAEIEKQNNINIDKNNKKINGIKKDNTTAKGRLPQTGESLTIFIVFGLCVVVLIVLYKKVNNYK